MKLAQPLVPRRLQLWRCLSMLVLATCSVASLAQERLTIVSPFPPGGPVDTLARFLADGLSQRYGQVAVVENLQIGRAHV